MTGPAQAVNAERSVLGAAMYSADAYRDAAALLTADDFYQPRHAALWQVIGALVAEGLPADPVLVLDRITRVGDAGKVGGAPYLAELYACAAPEVAVPHHAALIADAATRRRLEQAGQRIAQRAAAGDLEVAELAAWAAEQVSTARDDRAGVRLLTQPWEEWIAQTDDDRRMVVPGIFGQGDRLVLTGHGGLGKSTLLRQIAVCAAAGLQPIDFMTEDPFDPLRVSIVDCENPDYRTKAALWPMVKECLELGTDPRPLLHVGGNGHALDVLNPANALSLLRTIERDRPQLVLIGPVYKMHNGDPNAEETAKQVTSVLDQIREIDGAVVLTEAHHNKEGKKGGSLEPSGSNLWTWWPEFGAGLRLAPGDEAEMMRRCDLERWRIDREASLLPEQIEASGKPGLKWARADVAGDRFARFVDPAPQDLGAPLVDRSTGEVRDHAAGF